jgi:hypothetical protein
MAVGILNDGKTYLGVHPDGKTYLALHPQNGRVAEDSTKSRRESWGAGC